ncbi:hypothetical protein GOL99_12405 [Sinorhizobium medicae]|nr:hypothetical protein [Sinorhizobium medicae]
MTVSLLIEGGIPDEMAAVYCRILQGFVRLEAAPVALRIARDLRFGDAALAIDGINIQVARSFG